MTGKFSLKMIWESVDWSIVAGVQTKRVIIPYKQNFIEGIIRVVWRCEKTSTGNPKLLIYGKWLSCKHFFQTPGPNWRR